MNNTTNKSRRIFLQNMSVLAAGIPLLKLNSFGAPLRYPPIDIAHNTPKAILSDKRIKLQFDEEYLVMDKGLQPSMLCTRKGTLVLQAQLPQKPYPQERIYYPWAVKTVVSRDGGKNWTDFPGKEGINEVNVEGAICQLKDGTILGLETYVTPGDKPGTGAGLYFTSTDDYKTRQGPFNFTINMPGTNFKGSSDDGGRPHEAMRIHRRVVELPNGDLLTTLYGWVEGDNAFSGYMPTMRKTSAMLLKSINKGKHWELVSIIASGDVGTEGFGEPVLTRVSRGRYAGRLICQMRTGNELYEAMSSDNGLTWSKAKPRVYADRDVFKTSEWAEMFKDVKRYGKLVSENLVEFNGAVVDPDLIEMRNGVLVAAFGVRIPARASWTKPDHPWNGNYLAFSLDGGDTWSHVEQLTSGIPTTHYMCVEQMPDKNEIFVVYDWGHWTYKPGRYTYGRKVTVKW